MVLGSRPTFFIPRWTTNLRILFQVCDARGGMVTQSKDFTNLVTVGFTRAAVKDLLLAWGNRIIRNRTFLSECDTAGSSTLGHTALLQRGVHDS